MTGNNKKNPGLDADSLSVLIAQEVEEALAARLGRIGNSTVKKAIEQSVRDVVSKKLATMLPQQIDKIVEQSITEIVGGLSGPKAPRKAKLTPANDFRSGGKSSPASGGKSGSKTASSPRSGAKSSSNPASGSKSGSKASTYTPPSRRSFGGKGGGRFGGK